MSTDCNTNHEPVYHNDREGSLCSQRRRAQIARAVHSYGVIAKVYYPYVICSPGRSRTECPIVYVYYFSLLILYHQILEYAVPLDLLQSSPRPTQRWLPALLAFLRVLFQHPTRDTPPLLLLPLLLFALSLRPLHC